LTSEEADRLLAACRVAGGHADEQRLLKTEIDKVQLFKSGTSQTYEVTFSDGSRGAFKSIEGVEATAAGWGHTPCSVILNDVAAWLIARGLDYGSLVRGVVVTTCPEPSVGIGSMQTWLEGQPSASGWETASQIRHAALFDAVIGQQDRNGSNFVYDDSLDELGLFDQSFTFPLPGHQQGASEIVNRVHADGTGQLDQELEDALDRLEVSAEFATVQQILAPDRFNRMVERIGLIRQQGQLLQGGEY
jgi:hypothetical protein